MPHAFPQCAEATTVRAACTGLVDDLHRHWELPAVYLLLDGRLRCQASRGYFQVSDGHEASTGIVGRAVTSGVAVVLQDACDDPDFIAAIPGLTAEACVPVRVHGAVVGAVNLESRHVLSDEAVAEVHAAALYLGARLEALGGVPALTPPERLARVAVALAAQTSEGAVGFVAVRGAIDVSGMSTAALATLDGEAAWSVTHALGPVRDSLLAWDDSVLRTLAGWVSSGTSSYFPDGEAVPAGHEVLGEEVHALSVQPLIVAGQVMGLLITADAKPRAHDPGLTTTMELLAAQAAATLATVRTLEHLERQASQDPLTGLANRRRLLDELGAEASRLPFGKPSAALVLLDLDGFKAVNDRHGHAVGDAVLTAVAHRLKASARPGDLVCRLGGDEFAVLVRGLTTESDVIAIGQRLLQAAGDVDPDNAQPSVGASAGIRTVTSTTASSVLVDADVALYAAKRRGPGHCVMWDAALRDAERDEVVLVDDLRQAIADDSLFLAYQPVVDIQGLRVLGVEALCRWDHPVRGSVPPSVFVAAAERAGVVRDLTRWVLRTAFREAARWPTAADGTKVNVAVNISAAQLADDGVVHDVAAALSEAGLSASHVVLEVTETAEVVDLACAKGTLDALAALGVVLALDDFGTGFSSLSHAQALPFDILKIDRSFVAAAALGDRRALATIAAVCALAARLGVDVVAEGVEDEDQLTDLRALGCSHAQGYALARPMSASAITSGLEGQGSDGWVLGRPLGAVPALVSVPSTRSAPHAAGLRRTQPSA